MDSTFMHNSHGKKKTSQEQQQQNYSIPNLSSYTQNSITYEHRCSTWIDHFIQCGLCVYLIQNISKVSKLKKIWVCVGHLIHQKSSDTISTENHDQKNKHRTYTQKKELRNGKKSRNSID